MASTTKDLKDLVGALTTTPAMGMQEPLATIVDTMDLVLMPPRARARAGRARDLDTSEDMPWTIDA